MATLDQVHARVAAPPVVPHPFGLFSVAAPITPADAQWQMGVSWESWACITPHTTTDPCINGTDPDPKTFEDCPATQTAKPVTVYLGIRRGGQSTEVGTEQLTRVLSDAEEFGVEQFLWAELAAAVTEGTAAPALLALATVETSLGTGYMGTGVIHMGRGVATRLADSLVRVGDHLETVLGTPVAVGAGYGNGAIYGTGTVAVRRGALAVVSAWDTSINDELVLGERTYVVGWDCFATGVNVAAAT